MRALAILCLALVLSGCSAPGGTDAPPTATVDGGAGRFLAPVDLGQGGPEPVIVFSPEGGHAYVAAQDPTGGGPRVWISTDDGATWTMKRPTTQGGGEVDVAAGPGGMVYLTQLGVRGNVVSVSRDFGETWQTSPLGAATQYFDREWLAVDSQGRVFVVAREFGVTASAGVARSDDRGLTFPPRGKAWTALDEPGEANGAIVAVGTAVHLVYVCVGGEGICVSTSRDGGLRWEQVVVATRNVNVANVYPTIAAAGGALLVAWSDASDGALAVHASRSTDAGASWSSPLKVSTEGGTATLPWLAARGDATWLVYLHTDAAFSATDCPESADAPWYAHAQRLTREGAPTGEAVRVAETLVHTGVISPPVGQTCSGGARDRNFGDFFTAAVAPSGKLLVAVSVDEGTPESTRDIVVRER